jgi:hypothetical protein
MVKESTIVGVGLPVRVSKRRLFGRLRPQISFLLSFLIEGDESREAPATTVSAWMVTFSSHSDDVGVATASSVLELGAILLQELEKSHSKRVNDPVPYPMD